MKYTIVSVSDKRERYKWDIREAMVGHEEVTDIDFVGPDEAHEYLVYVKNWTTYPTQKPPYTGELGVWGSQIKCWEWVRDNEEPLIVFEDDAIVRPGFTQWYADLVDGLEMEPDVLSLWVNPYQHWLWNHHWRHDTSQFFGDGHPNNRITDKLSWAYQDEGAVALQIFPGGANKMLDTIESKGFNRPVDCWLFERSWPVEQDRLHVYAPNPKNNTGISVYLEAETQTRT